jgi:hypothetical protein
MSSAIFLETPGSSWEAGKALGALLTDRVVTGALSISVEPKAKAREERMVA